MTLEQVREVKWVSPDSPTGFCKQHGFIKKTVKTKYSREEYDGNKSLCGIGSLINQDENIEDWDKVESEQLQLGACKRCRKLAKL